MLNENNDSRMCCNMNDYNNDNNNNSDCACEEMNQTRREMINRIRCLEFAINELALYLDTHPEESKALCLHRKYTKEVRELKDKYQKVYGPLTINFPCNKWRWLEEPWPWEGGMN